MHHQDTRLAAEARRRIEDRRRHLFVANADVAGLVLGSEGRGVRCRGRTHHTGEMCHPGPKELLQYRFINFHMVAPDYASARHSN